MALTFNYYLTSITHLVKCFIINALINDYKNVFIKYFYSNSEKFNIDNIFLIKNTYN